jgi:GT2 family glycosyltransferase
MFAPWKIVHIELSQGIPELPFYYGIQGACVVFWWHGIPLGEQKIQVDQLPMPAFQLRQLATKAITPAVGDHLVKHGFKARLPMPPSIRLFDKPPDLQTLMALDQPLRRLRRHLSQPRDGLPCLSVSVVVCTRDRPEHLVLCLRSLEKLSERPYEILVIDNAPTSDATRCLVSETPEVRYILEPRPGLSIARNKGIENSSADVIAFTDDDVMVHPDWITRLRQSFQSPAVMAVTGLVLPAELETEAQFLFQQGNEPSKWGYRALTFDSDFFELMKSRGVPVWRIGAGANMAFRRKIFDIVGDFDERLGAGAAGCSEDSELWYRVLAQGWLCRYEPTAVVYHYHRKELSDLEHQIYHYMRGHMAALLIQFDKYRHWGNLYRAFGVLPWYYTKLFRKSLRNLMPGPKSQAGTLGAQIRGCLAGVKYYLQNRSCSSRFGASADKADWSEQEYISK